MTTNELLFLAQAAIKAIEPNASCKPLLLACNKYPPYSFLLVIKDEVLTNLIAVFPEKLVIAALDLIDRRNVIHYVTPWGHTEYEVLGSTETGTNRNVGDSVSAYSVLLDIHWQASPIPYSCSCPAFLHSVLKSDTHIMCKHILASLIARQMNMSITRPTSLDELAAMFKRQFPSPDLTHPSE